MSRESTPAQLGKEIRAALTEILAALRTGSVPDVELFNTINGSTAALQDIAQQSTQPLPVSALRVPDEQWERNSQRSSSGAYRCILCNLPVAESKAVWVLMSSDWEILPTALEAEHPDNMGCHTVGTECARKIPASHK